MTPDPAWLAEVLASAPAQPSAARAARLRTLLATTTAGPAATTTGPASTERIHDDATQHPAATG